MPFIGLLGLALIIVTYIPSLSTWLPSLVESNAVQLGSPDDDGMAGDDYDLDSLEEDDEELDLDSFGGDGEELDLDSLEGDDEELDLDAIEAGDEELELDTLEGDGDELDLDAVEGALPE